MAESSHARLSPSKIVRIFSTGGSARAIQKESFWPSIDMLLSNNYLLPKDVARLLTKFGIANAIQKDAFFPAIVRLIEEFSFTAADIQKIVCKPSAPNRIQQSDFFERVSFLQSLGFSSCVMPRMFDNQYGQAFLFLTDPAQIESRAKMFRWLIFEEDGGLGLGVDVVCDMFFVGSTSPTAPGTPTDRAKAIDDPNFCPFIQIIRDRSFLRDVGRIYRQTWKRMDECVAEEAAAAADEAFADRIGPLPLNSRAMRVPDVYAIYFAQEGEFKRLRICLPSDQTREGVERVDSFIEDQISANDPMPHQLQQCHEVQDEKVSHTCTSTSDPGDHDDNFPTVSTDEEMGEGSCTASNTGTNASNEVAAQWGDWEGDAHDSDESDEGCCWACLNCTLQNSLEKRRCGACNTLRPAPYYIIN